MMITTAVHRTAALPIRMMAALALALAVATGAHLGLAEAQEADDPRSDPAAYTKAFVQQAIDRYELSGLDETVEYYNTQGSIDGQWYVFIFDIRPVLVADAENPNLVGRNAGKVLGSNGYPLGEAIVGAARSNPEGVWLDYNFVDPASGRYETKHLWVVLHNLLVFGSGWYEPGPSRSQLSAFTQAFVQQAVNLYAAAGRDRMVDYFNSARSTDNQWYVFIADEEGVLIADPTMPANVGQSLLGDVGVDETGYPFGLDLLTATGDGPVGLLQVPQCTLRTGREKAHLGRQARRPLLRLGLVRDAPQNHRPAGNGRPNGPGGLGNRGRARGRLSRAGRLRRAGHRPAAAPRIGKPTPAISFMENGGSTATMSR